MLKFEDSVPATAANVVAAEAQRPGIWHPTLNCCLTPTLDSGTKKKNLEFVYTYLIS